MILTDLEYKLPTELIAQEPLIDRENSRLLVLNKNSGEIEHRFFRDIVEYFNNGDMLIINNTRVIPAKLIVTKPSGGRIEILLIKELEEDKDGTAWEIISEGKYEGFAHIDGIETIIKRHKETKKIIFLNMDKSSVKELIFEKGFMPLPPYIKRKPDRRDRETYQTVYAKKNGSIAAPTAGLHFTEKLIDSIRNKGVFIGEITLHVGVGTFKMIKVHNIKEHEMDSEYFEISKKLIERINFTKSNGKKVFSVGTTTTRALEGFASKKYKKLDSDEEIVRGYTDIFIYPGYEFKIVDVLITNFHLPKSSPLALVYAFCEIDKIKKAYEEAIKERYRFFSYGDAMLII